MKRIPHAFIAVGLLQLAACTNLQVPVAGLDGLADATGSAYRPYPIVADDRCYKELNHDAADLCAQWRAAYAAEAAANRSWWANVLAACAAALSFLGFLALIYTLRQTERSLREQRRSFADSRRIGEAQVRCYLAVESIGFTFKDDGKPAVEARIANVGSSPAIDVSWRCRIAYTMPGGYERTGDWERDYPANVVIQPQGRPLMVPVTLNFAADANERAILNADDKNLASE